MGPLCGAIIGGSVRTNTLRLANQTISEGAHVTPASTEKSNRTALNHHPKAMESLSLKSNFEYFLPTKIHKMVDVFMSHVYTPQLFKICTQRHVRISHAKFSFYQNSENKIVRAERSNFFPGHPSLFKFDDIGISFISSASSFTIYRYVSTE